MTEENVKTRKTDNIGVNIGDKQSTDNVNKTREDYGYDFFPERLGKQEKPTWKWLFEGRNAARSFKCISNVYQCAQKHAMVKLLIGALKSHGCPVDFTRHVSCEDCFAKVNGGFDPVNKQVVVCQNNSTNPNVCCSVLGHELTHMFDYCRAKVDFTNLDHLACTEIRAANFFHCSFMAAWTDGEASLLNYKAKHQECVKKKATLSVLAVRDVDEATARAAVDRVFTKCYNDLEPFGRRMRPKSRDPDRALSEGFFYGYCDNIKA